MKKIEFDDKNAFPDDVVEQLTDGWCTFNRDMAVGFIKGIPAIFKWKSNQMHIKFETHNEFCDCLLTIVRYVAKMIEAQPEWFINTMVINNSFNIYLYEKDED
ncbi:MAG: hypothetical protein ACI4SO_07570 [Muribaculaceae bacterium]